MSVCVRVVIGSQRPPTNMVCGRACRVVKHNHFFSTVFLSLVSPRNVSFSLVWSGLRQSIYLAVNVNNEDPRDVYLSLPREKKYE